MTVRVRIPRKLERTLLVPESALQRDTVGYFAMAVNDDGVVVRKDVTVGELDEDMRIIEKGLEPTDRIVVRGIHARPAPASRLMPKTASDSSDGSAPKKDTNATDGVKDTDKDKSANDANGGPAK